MLPSNQHVGGDEGIRELYISGNTSLFPDQGGAKMRLRDWLPRAGKRCTVHQYTTVIMRAKYPSLLFISPMPESQPTRSPNRRRSTRVKWEWKDIMEEVVNIEQDIKPQTTHVKPMCARRFAKKASK
jgi:hypothetical protein